MRGQCVEDAVRYTAAAAFERSLVGVFMGEGMPEAIGEAGPYLSHCLALGTTR